MHDASDMELLRDYDRQGSEAAFAALVQRHINLVYSVALRHVGIAAHAEEITQAVFIILARKAAGLRADTILEGWLHETTRLTALSFLRGERRRQFREQEAYMQSTLQEHNDAATWNQLAPLLDEAVSRLGKKDRDAVMLRFFKDKNLREVAAALNVNEAAAQRRVHRAVEKLRGFFTKRGAALSSVAIAGAISANSVQAAPAALAKSVTAVAIAKDAAVSGSTLTLVKETLKIMTHAKLKLAIGITAGILLVGGATTMVISQTTGDDKLTPQEIAKQSQDAYAALMSYSDSGTVVTEMAGKNIKTTFNIRLARPNLYRIDSIMMAGPNSLKGAAWSDGSGDYFETGTGKEKTKDMQAALASATMMGNSAIAAPEIFFKLTLGDPMGFIVTGKVETKREKDGQVGDVDCYIISSVVNTAKMRAEVTLLGGAGKMGMANDTRLFWIGKRDHFIHQIQSSVDFASTTSASPARLSDADIKKLLEKENKPVTAEAIVATRTRLEALAKKMQSMMKGKVIVTETHERIVVNQKFSPTDFQKAQ
jgi:RNA polymerase sigma factor (sigma-70 family)